MKKLFGALILICFMCAQGKELQQISSVSFYAEPPFDTEVMIKIGDDFFQGVVVNCYALGYRYGVFYDVHKDKEYSIDSAIVSPENIFTFVKDAQEQNNEGLYAITS